MVDKSATHASICASSFSGKNEKIVPVVKSAPFTNQQGKKHILKQMEAWRLNIRPVIKPAEASGDMLYRTGSICHQLVQLQAPWLQNQRCTSSEQMPSFKQQFRAAVGFSSPPREWSNANAQCPQPLCSSHSTEHPSLQRRCPLFTLESRRCCHSPKGEELWKAHPASIPAAQNIAPFFVQVLGGTFLGVTNTTNFRANIQFPVQPSRMRQLSRDVTHSLKQPKEAAQAIRNAKQPIQHVKNRDLR